MIIGHLSISDTLLNKIRHIVQCELRGQEAKTLLCNDLDCLKVTGMQRQQQQQEPTKFIYQALLYSIAIPLMEFSLKIN